jgi:hypothetical protein
MTSADYFFVGLLIVALFSAVTMVLPRREMRREARHGNNLYMKGDVTKQK